jgi:hypothetical protein
MPRVGFELTFAVFERAKAFHALNCTATVFAYQCNRILKYIVTYLLKTGISGPKETAVAR